MIGCVIGDAAGSIYEFNNIKTKDFPFMGPGCTYTDDTVLAMATAQWLLHGGNVAEHYARFATDNPSPMGDYGPRFLGWVNAVNNGMGMEPYNSCGNGSAMRVGPVGWAFDTVDEVLEAAKQSAQCTHNHPEGIKGAQATALAILMARQGSTKEEIKTELTRRFGYDLSMTVDETRPRYCWGGLDNAGDGGTCQGSVPQAIICFLDSTGFEDAVRNAVSIGGDSDTIACITGGIAEAFYGVPQALRDHAMALLKPQFREILSDFEARFGTR